MENGAIEPHAKVEFSAQFNERPVREQIDYLKKLVSSQNHALDLMQKERDALAQKLGVAEAQLQNADNAVAIQKKIGQQVKGRKGGRPRTERPGYKKERRVLKQPEAIRLRVLGKSIREIARTLNIPISTLHRWV